MTHSTIRVALIGALFAVTAATRQSVPVTTLGKPIAEFPEGNAVRWVTLPKRARLLGFGRGSV